MSEDGVIAGLRLVVGGAASGKSRHAEALVRAAPGQRIYLASAQAYDDEMRAKIARHRDERSSDGWRTLEVPLEVADALAELGPDHVVLFDCATLWLSNLIYAERDWRAEAERLLAVLLACPAQVTVVTNEVGQGIVPENALARRFRQAQGELNQMLAARAEEVIAVIAGLPLHLKGTP